MPLFFPEWASIEQCLVCSSHWKKKWMTTVAAAAVVVVVVATQCAHHSSPDKTEGCACFCSRGGEKEDFST